MFVYGVAVMG